mmetsp:Transcript_38343/g.95374  ORF Transcript_38343/g.95374 Transcript_38343/m.95374 type:complete len:208 (-) Transcript_38343:1935-2558(-)
MSCSSLLLCSLPRWYFLRLLPCSSVLLSSLPRWDSSRTMSCSSLLSSSSLIREIYSLLGEHTLDLDICLPFVAFVPMLRFRLPCAKGLIQLSSSSVSSRFTIGAPAVPLFDWSASSSSSSTTRLRARTRRPPGCVSLDGFSSVASSWPSSLDGPAAEAEDCARSRISRVIGMPAFSNKASSESQYPERERAGISLTRATKCERSVYC